MIKRRHSLFAALALAGASLAHAGQLDSTSNLGLLGQNASFSNVLTGGNAGQSFLDTYAFTTNAMGVLSADLLVKHANEKNGVAISNFSLYDAGWNLIDGGAMAKSAGTLWELSYDKLAAGSYYLQVSGSMLSNAAGRYSADLVFAPVPEPGNITLMAAGLGLLGLVSRRRRNERAG
jgi:hypothetical protein